MTDDKNILIRIQTDAAKPIQDLVTIKQRLVELKTAQSQVNQSTTQGKATALAYQGQISALAKEQKSLENSVTQTAKSFQNEVGSIAHNRAELSKLTAEYIKLGQPTEQQTTRIRVLSDTLKQQESAIGNNTRNVGDYFGAIEKAGLANNAFGQNLGAVKTGLANLKGGIDLAKGGFTSLGASLATTGLPLLILGFTAIAELLKKTDGFANLLAGSTKALTQIFSVLGKGLQDVGTYLAKIFSEPKQLIVDLGNLIKENLINRIQAFGVLGKSIVKIFSGDLKQGFTDLANGTVQLSTGVTDITGKIGKAGKAIAEFSKNIADSTAQAFNLAYEFDKLNDAQVEYSKTNAEVEKTLAGLLIQLRNRTNTERESLAIADKASKLELENFKQKKSFAEQNYALIQKENALTQTTRELNDEEVKKETEAKVAIINLEQQSLEVQEKINNRRDLIIQQGEAKRQAAFDKEQKRIADLDKLQQEEYTKELERIKSLDSSYSDLQDYKLEREIKINANLEAGNSETLNKIKSDTKLNLDDRLNLVDQYSKNQIDLITDSSNKEIILNAQKTARLLEDTALNGNQRALIEQKNADTIADITAKAESNKNAIIQSSEEYKRAEILKTSKFQQAENDKQLASTAGLFGSIAGLFKQSSKAYKIFASAEVLISTARAVINALASGSKESPYTGIAAAIAAGATGAVELAQINQVQFAKGGLLEGNSHSAGGIQGTGTFNNVEVEGGEYIVNKKATAQYFPLLAKINESALTNNTSPISGKYASGGLLDGGLTSRVNSQPIINNIDSRNETLRLLSLQPTPVLRVTDLNNLNNKISKVTSITNI